MNAIAESIVKCTLETGGGQYRCVNHFSESCTTHILYQRSLKSRQEGATVIPIIISSDKTQLTHFRGKAAYPVYLTIGNIPKEIRRKPSRHAQMLIAYLPVTKLEGMANKTARRRALANIFHICMRTILAPIATPGETGVTMMSGDGIWRRCHPIFAVFIGDFPEQSLVTCTYTSRCPKCLVPSGELGDNSTFPPRDYNEALNTYKLCSGEARVFNARCREVGLKPVFHPFWEILPFTDIFVSITPDILHQLLQGLVKHTVGWLVAGFGSAAIDACCRSLPPNHHITIFAKGISFLSRVTGQEHKNMCRILLGLILDLPLRDGQLSTRIIRAVRALLDFIYLAQFPSHTTDTLAQLQESLARFHDNKAVFVDLELQKAMNFPKLHSMSHYQQSITLFGTTDNYNTEQTERLHIDFTRYAYEATNWKDEYPQMTTWMERREKIQQHTCFVHWRKQTSHEDRHPSHPLGAPCAESRSIQMTRKPTWKAVSFDSLAYEYGAVDFQDELAHFIAFVNHPRASAAALSGLAADTLIPFRKVPMYHKIKFTTSTSDKAKVVDVVHVQPEQKDARGRPIPARFDTVIVRGRTQVGLHGNNGTL